MPIVRSIWKTSRDTEREDMPSTHRTSAPSRASPLLIGMKILAPAKVKIEFDCDEADSGKDMFLAKYSHPRIDLRMPKSRLLEPTQPLVDCGVSESIFNLTIHRRWWCIVPSVIQAVKIGI